MYPAGDLDYWARQRIQEMEARETHRKNNPPTAAGSLDDELSRLEYNFARALLLLQSMIEICHRKGVFSPEELDKVAAEIDLLDGRADGVLDPSAVAGMRSASTSSVGGFLRDLKRGLPPEDSPPFDIQT